MIAKKVTTKNVARDPRKLVAYMLDNEASKHGDRVGEVWVTNSPHEDPQAAAVAIAAHQTTTGPTRKSDPTYHLVISFAEEDREKLDGDTLREIESRMVSALGLEDHARITAVHENTSNKHMHVAIDLVDDRGRLNAPKNDFRKLTAAREELAEEFGLKLAERDFPRDREHEGGKRSAEGKAADRQGPVQSFEGWAREVVTPTVAKIMKDDALTWSGLQDALADHGVELRKRGAGLVVADRERKLFCKASSVHRGLGLKGLEKRLGAFQPSASKRKAKNPYEQKARGGSAELYEEFQELKEGVLNGRRKLRSENQKQFTEALADARATAKERRDQLRPLKPSEHKSAAYKILVFEQAKAVEEAREIRRRSNKEVTASSPLPSWLDYLNDRANEGDERAVSALRHRSRSKGKGGGDHMTGKPQEGAEGRILRDLDFKVEQSGAVSYTTKDGAQFRDTGRHLNLGDRFEESAVEAALDLAMTKFGGKLEINGSDEFKKAVVEVAARRKMPVRFTDRGMERERKSLASGKGRGSGR